MNILVCISHVPDTTSKINFTNDNTAFDTNGIQFVINPYDEFALTRALQLKEAQGGSVTVLNVGPASTEPTIRKALAIGADNAIRINAEATDAFYVATQISEVIKQNNYDIILCGQESLDYNGGQVHGMIAGILNYPFATACVGLEIDGTSATILREIDGGKEEMKASLPIVIGGKKGLVEERDLRIPNMRGIMMSRSKPLQLIEPIEAETRIVAKSYDKPTPKAEVTLIDKDNVEELVQLLHNEAKAI
jgi:electron transfer flavoprotein beta subunit